MSFFASDETKEMMRYGPYVATIVLLFFALFITIGATIFGVINAFSNPIEWYTGVYGLLVWHGVAGKYHENSSFEQFEN